MLTLSRSCVTVHAPLRTVFSRNFQATYRSVGDRLTSRQNGNLRSLEGLVSSNIRRSYFETEWTRLPRRLGEDDFRSKALRISPHANVLKAHRGFEPLKDNFVRMPPKTRSLHALPRLVS